MIRKTLVKKVTLVALFTDGPRYMFERQDAMSYVRLNGRPDLFITMSTNPNWNKIRQKLQQSHQAHDRPNFTVLDFKLKLQNMNAF